MVCAITEFQQEQKKRMRAVQDSMDVLNGKWKICYYLVYLLLQKKAIF
jgi:hypothetical protein